MKMQAWIAAMGSLFCLLVLSGCVCIQVNSSSDSAGGPQFAAVSPLERRMILGESVEGRPIGCLEFGRGPEVILILASIHGNEAAGTPLVRELARRLRQKPRWLRGKMIVIVPVANPDGVAHHHRSNIRGVDLNRNFAAANRVNSKRYGEEPLSEPESRVIDMLLWKYNPDRIVSIHQPLKVVDYDGPAKALARAMAGRTDLPLKKLGARPGSLGAYAGETLGIPIITLELPRDVESQGTEWLWRHYGKSLLAFIRYEEGREGGRSMPAARGFSRSAAWYEWVGDGR